MNRVIVTTCSRGRFGCPEAQVWGWKSCGKRKESVRTLNGTVVWVAASTQRVRQSKYSPGVLWREGLVEASAIAALLRVY